MMTLTVLSFGVMAFVVTVSAQSSTFDIKCGVEEMRDEVLEKVDTVTQNMETVREQIGAVQQTMVTLNKKITSIQQKMDTEIKSNQQHMVTLEEKLDDLKELLERVVANTAENNADLNSTTQKTTTELKDRLPRGSKMIYVGEGWKYFKIPIPAGNFNITGTKLMEVCRQNEMETPCPCSQRCYHLKQCVVTSHMYSNCIGNLINLQQAITGKGGKSLDKDYLQYTFVYSLPKKEEIDGACGYWPSYYCHDGKKTVSDGVNKFALCALEF